MTTERAWLIDASIYIFRAWFSMPDRWHTQDGMPVSAVYGYTKFLLDFLDMQGTEFYGVVAFDESLGSNYRNDIYPNYKVSRELPDDELAFQLDACRQVTQKLGFTCYGGPRYEADDYLASAARRYRQQGTPVTVVTRDKDLGQIIGGPDDAWWDFAQDVTLDEKSFYAKFGVRPNQFGDYLALVGDSIDDIPGVPGVGAKTAAALLQSYDTLAALEAGLTTVNALKIRGAAKVQERLIEHWPQVLVSRQLTGLADDIPEVSETPRFMLTERALTSTIDYLESLDLGGALPRRCKTLMASVSGTASQMGQ
ncbi:MAG: 5'-3' exonuclease H3TH domain-containing protein [Halioglobus sp.]